MEVFRMYPIIAGRNAEDIHVQHILLLSTCGNLAVSGKYIVKKLLSQLALRQQNRRKPSIPVTSVYRYHRLHGAGRTNRSINKGVPSIYHIIEEASSVKSYTTNQRNSSPQAHLPHPSCAISGRHYSPTRSRAAMALLTT